MGQMLTGKEPEGYAECYPGMSEMNDAIDDSDDEADYSKMDLVCCHQRFHDAISRTPRVGIIIECPLDGLFHGAPDVIITSQTAVFA